MEHRLQQYLSKMIDDLLKLRKIAAKSFRKAKRWYAGYLSCQFAVLVFAIISIFAELNPNLSAVIAFVAVLCTESVRWRSDHLKSEGEWAKRKYEVADGLGTIAERTRIVDCLAAKPKGFLADVSNSEIQGSEFDNTQPPGPRRIVENTEESAWWSKHLSTRMVFFLGLILLLTIVAGFLALTLSIAALKNANDKSNGTIVQNVGGILCSVLVFVFSVNIVRLLSEFWTFTMEAKEILARCAELLKGSEIAERDALSIMHDYQTARNSAPLLPTFAWKFHGDHLREQWRDFRCRPSS